MKIPIKKRKELSNYFSKQKGQKYPCSNQCVLCGFFGTEEQWEDFVESKKNEIKNIYDKNRFFITNSERWRFFNIDSTSWENYRGLRYYKLKVNKKIKMERFYRYILPYASLYCCELEWI